MSIFAAGLRAALVGRRRAAALVLIALTCLLPLHRAYAACSYTGNGANVTFSVPTSITVPFDAQVGDVLYQTPQVAPSPSLSVSCTGSSTYGISNLVGANPGVGVAIYPTGVSGVGYRLAHGSSSPSDYMYPWPCCELASGTYNFTVTTALQLVKTGPIADGARLNGATLARWMYDRTGNRTVSLQNYILGNAVTFVSPACQVNTTSVAVALPRISDRALPSVGSTAGTTPFRINLTCRSGATLEITFATNSPVTGRDGVIANSNGSGRATGVGVQLTRSDAGSTPVRFGTPITAGATVNGAVDLTYLARYYRTGNVTPGTISTQATFTLTYE